MSLAALFNIHWGDYTSELLNGLLKTVEFTIAGFVGAALLGLVLALMRLSTLLKALIRSKTLTSPSGRSGAASACSDSRPKRLLCSTSRCESFAADFPWWERPW